MPSENPIKGMSTDYNCFLSNSILLKATEKKISMELHFITLNPCQRDQGTVMRTGEYMPRIFLQKSDHTVSSALSSFCRRQLFFLLIFMHGNSSRSHADPCFFSIIDVQLLERLGSSSCSWRDMASLWVLPTVMRALDVVLQKSIAHNLVLQVFTIPSVMTMRPLVSTILIQFRGHALLYYRHVKTQSNASLLLQ